MEGALTLAGLILVAKSTLVVAGAAGLSFLLRRGTAASRHAVWTGTLVVLLVLPALPLVQGGLPTIPVPVLQGVASGRSGQDTHGAPEARADGLPGHEAFLGLGAEFSSVATARADLGPTRLVRESRPDRADLGQWLTWFWLVGTLVCLVPLAVGLARGRRMVRSALLLRTPEWLRVVRRAARRVGLPRPVPTRLALGARSAMAGGVIRPVVLLPREAIGWSPERRDLVLLHEFVHVKRRDPARHILGRVVTAFYWFHPLVWWAAQAAAMAREEACDERVVEIGGLRPSIYAEHLLDLDRPQPVAAGLTGFHHPDLEKRIRAILEPASQTRRMTGLIAGTFALLLTVSVVLLAPPRGAGVTQASMHLDPPTAPVPLHPAPEGTPPTAPVPLHPAPKGTPPTAGPS